MQLPEVNHLDRAAFVGYFGGVLEHSPRYAERAWERRPFQSLLELQGAFADAVLHGEAAEKLALIRAHPDLAGKVARAGELTAESSREQSSAGLDRLTDEEYIHFERINAAYHQKFMMPFVICVREHSKASIFEQAERRLRHSSEQEIDTALREIIKIAALRLADLVQAEVERDRGRNA